MALDLDALEEMLGQEHTALAWLTAVELIEELRRARAALREIASMPHEAWKVTHYYFLDQEETP